jgi:hypothetical protein
LQTYVVVGLMPRNVLATHWEAQRTSKPLQTRRGLSTFLTNADWGLSGKPALSYQKEKKQG